MWTSAEVIAAKSISAIRKNSGLVVVTPFARLMWWLAARRPTLPFRAFANASPRRRVMWHYCHNDQRLYGDRTIVD